MNKQILTLGLIVFLTACSTVAEKRSETALSVENAQPKIRTDLAYTVLPGDFLSKIAQKTTGNGENWREIARYNNITNPNELNKNDTVMIPGHLLPANKSNKPVVEISTASIDKNPVKPAEKKPIKKAEKIKPTRNNSEWVMVEGSYYPKAIYRKPNYTAGMLTRVLPGTTLKHIKTSDEWIHVETEKGKGYLHRSDARRLSKNELSLKTSSEF